MVAPAHCRLPSPRREDQRGYRTRTRTSTRQEPGPAGRFQGHLSPQVGNESLSVSACAASELGVQRGLSALGAQAGTHPSSSIRLFRDAHLARVFCRQIPQASGPPRGQSLMPGREQGPASCTLDPDPLAKPLPSVLLPSVLLQKQNGVRF